MTTNSNIEDYRDLKPYYNLVNEIMKSVSFHAFKKNYLNYANSLRELIVITAPYVNKPKDKLSQIDSLVDKLINEKFYYNGSFISNLGAKDEEELLKAKSQYMSEMRLLRVEINEDWSKKGLMPKTFEDDGRPGVTRNR